MPHRLVDWTVRTLMLVLAGLVTLSMLGAISAMSNEAGRPGLNFTGPPPEANPRPPADPAPAASQAGNGPARSSAPSGSGGEIVAVGTPRDEPGERWLEAIAWAMLALVFLGALALVLLFEAVRQLRRIASAAEGRGTMTAAQHSSRATGEKAS